MVSGTYPHLRRAPITEAILDINVAPSVNVEATSEFARRVAATHPQVLPLKTTMVLVSADAKQTPLAHSIVGQICWNEGKTRAVQARINGFTVNHVRNYQSWESLRDEAHPLWDEYISVMRPAKVCGLGLRYINRIAVPPFGEFGQYVNTHPQVGPGLPQNVRNFFMRVELPFSAKHTAFLSQTIIPPDLDTAEPGLILDIHAVSSQEFDPGSPQIWNELDQLREIKNACFFGSVKEQTWRKYE